MLDVWAAPGGSGPAAGPAAPWPEGRPRTGRTLNKKQILAHNALKVKYPEEGRTRYNMVSESERDGCSPVEEGVG
jgi:hypothetical protein